MNNFTPWLICIGVLIVYPAAAFALGYYIGKHGMPFEVHIRRKQGISDSYGARVDVD